MVTAPLFFAQVLEAREDGMAPEGSLNQEAAERVGGESPDSILRREAIEGKVETRRQLVLDHGSRAPGKTRTVDDDLFGRVCFQRQKLSAEIFDSHATEA